LQSGCWLGAYAATAVSIKPTYLTFIVPLAILLLTYGVARRQWAGIGLGMLVSFAIVVVGTLAVYLAYHGGDIDALAQHVMNLTGFVDGIARPMSFPAWLIMGLARWRDGATLPASIALIPLLVLSAVLLPNRAVSVGLLAGAALNLYVAWRRYHPNTLIETNDFTFLAAVVWAALVMEPALRAFPGLVALRLPRWSRTRPAPLQTAGLILALVLGARAVGQVIGGVAEVRRSFGAATTGDRALAAYLESRSGDVAFLIPDNDLRPLTVDSAIYKGGTNEIGAAWGGSPYVHAMFPGRHYFVGGLDPVRDPDLGQFRHIVFVRLPTDRDDADVAERLRKTFRIWLGGYDCDFRADLIYQEIVACERRVVSLAATGEPKARFVPIHEDPSPEAMEQYRDPDAAPTEFVATQRVMGGGLDVWQLHADGSLALVDAPDGARVWIEDIGVWDSASRALTGVNATYIGGRPRLDVLAPAASNTNSRFDRYGSRRQPLYGWQLEPRDDLPVVERLSDEEGQFIRVRPAAEGTAVTLYSRAPLSKLDDTPVTVRAVVRVHGSQPITLAISDVTGRDGRASVRWVSTKSSDRWETVSVWLHRASSPDERDSFSVRLSNPTSGSWMDLREVSLVEGIVP
jgi:hypothetical protein